MSYHNPLVEEIQEKVKTLVSQREEAYSKIKNLRDAVQSMEEQLLEKNNLLMELEQKYKVMKMAKSLEGGEVDNNKDLKLKINEMVREIDKCIALLNK
jgi:uncharacterized coiled-coil DUF342 family protein